MSTAMRSKVDRTLGSTWSGTISETSRWPGGWVVVTTPNQLSALSLLTLALRGRFSAFQDNAYPAHRTALLEIDLRRIMTESGLRDLAVTYTRLGRLPLSGWHYPEAVARLAPQRLSDNVVIAGRR